MKEHAPISRRRNLLSTFKFAYHGKHIMASFASTGDLQNNLHKLASLLRRIKYPHPPDPYSLSKGDPVALLPILHHILLDRSPLLARHFAARGHTLSGKTDARFVDGVYRLLRDEFAFRPAVNKAQFLATGFAERKCIFVQEVVRLCDELERDLKRFGNGENGGGKPKPKPAAAATASVAAGLHQRPINYRSTPTAATTQKKRNGKRNPAPLAAAAAAPPPLDLSPPKVQALLPNNVAVVTTANRSIGEYLDFRMSTRSSARSRSETSPLSFLHPTNHHHDKHNDGFRNTADLSWTHSSAGASSSSSSPRSRHAFGASMLCDDHDNTVSRAPTTAVNGAGEGYTIYEPRQDPPRPPAQMPPELANSNPNSYHQHRHNDDDDNDDSINALSFLTTSDVLRSTPRPPYKNPPAVTVDQPATATTTTSAGPTSPPPFQFLSRTWVAPTAPPANSTPVPPHPATSAPSHTVADGPLPLSATTSHPLPPPPPTSVLQAQDAMQPIFENFMRLFAAKEQVKCPLVLQYGQSERELIGSLPFQETNELRTRISALEAALARPPPSALVPLPTPPPPPPPQAQAPSHQEEKQDATPHPHAPSPPSSPPPATSASVSFRASVSTSQPTRFRDQHSRPVSIHADEQPLLETKCLLQQSPHIITIF
ncbi:Centrosomal protein of 44 kDa [Geranomyces variabilis]|uniref:Centrosomal protein of 44 kDa n=1 Tax=Geranomyces variabilis TaxID=109894 RepID=A0AAD5TN79_9FUNG|nr:Centrosomal protein of 44 kDa [Geranomyces variabilis]